MATDLNWWSNTYVLTGEGTPGSNTLSNAAGSGSSHPFTVTGGSTVAYSNAQSKYGTTSLYLDGTGGFYSDANTDVKQGDLTISFWVYPTNLAIDTNLYFWAASSAPGYDGGGAGKPFQLFTSGSTLRFYANSVGTNQTVGTLVANQWQQVRIVRSSSTWYLFLGGVLGASVYDTGTYTPVSWSHYFGSAGGARSAFQGYVDFFTVTPTVARNITNFTPGYDEPDPLTMPYAAALLSLPKPALVFNSGAALILSLPTPVVAAFSGSRLTLQSPSPNVVVTAHNASGERSMQYTLSTPALVAYGGGNASPDMPSALLSATGTFTAGASAALSMPYPTLDASGTCAVNGQAVLTFGSVYDTYTIVGFSGAVVSTTIDGATVSAGSTAGGIASANLTLPLFDLVGSGTAQSVGRAALLMPALARSSGAVAWLMAPSAQLTALGTAVVAVTYEGYSVNLAHRLADGAKPPTEVINEVTHYTNYPFDRIVRYQNSYYGMNSTGLYLLDSGTLDDTTPITYVAKTCETDFGDPHQKTVGSVYFGGRLGAAETVTLYVSEVSSQPYSYTTPRGTTPQNYRQAFGKGVKARYYALGVAGSNEFALDTVDFELGTMKRRI